MPSREEYLKWVKESGNGKVRCPLETHMLYPEEIEALCNRVWNEAILASTQVVNGYIGADPIMDMLEQLKQGEQK